MKGLPKRIVAATVSSTVLFAALAVSPVSAADAALPLVAGVTATAPTNDPDLGKQWALEAVNAFDAWEKARVDEKVTVAVIDNGFLVEHEDLKDNIIATYDAVTGSTDPADVAPFASGDSVWHGTHVCGIIAARANNGKGLAGVSYNAKLLPIKAFTSSTEASSADIAKAYDFVLEHAAEYNIKVVNFSGGHRLDGSDPDDDLVSEKIKKAYDAGIITVCAAGNGAESGPYSSFPGDLSDVALNVISLQKGASSGPGVSYSRAEDSNYNLPGQKTKDISAPGTSIYSTALLGNRVDWYREASGTSMAAPCVAGVAALVYAADGRSTAADVADILCRTATDLGAEGWDAEYGAGMVNADAAVMAALGVTSLSDADVELSSGDFVYDGSPKCPDASVVFEGRKLTLGVDYTVDYAGNTDAGTAEAVVCGIGAYTGTITKTFAIHPAAVDVPVAATGLVYSGGEQCGVKPTKGCSVSGGFGVAAGERVAVAKLDNSNYRWPDGSVGNRSVSWSIAPASLEGFKVNGVPTYRYRTGKAVQPVVEVERNGVLLEQGEDYAVAYKDNLASGTASVAITGKGNYRGSLVRTFEIVDKPAWSGATRLPVGADAVWKLSNCTIKVVGGASGCVRVSGGKIHGVRAGTAKVGVFNAAGARVAVKTVKIRRVTGSLRQVRLAANSGYRIAFDASSKTSRRSVRLHKGALKEARRCRFFLRSDGSYRIADATGSFALAAKTGSGVCLAKARDVKAQRWRLVVDSSGRSFFVNAKTGKTLCRAGRKPLSGSRLIQKKSPSVAASAWGI